MKPPRISFAAAHVVLVVALLTLAVHEMHNAAALLLHIAGR